MAEVLPYPKVSWSTIVAGNVRAEAARRGFSQTQLAHILGMAQPNVSARWHGRRPFSLDELELLADAFGVHVETLVRCPRPDSNREPTGSLCAVIDLAARRARLRAVREVAVQYSRSVLA